MNTCKTCTAALFPKITPGIPVDLKTRECHLHPPQVAVAVVPKMVNGVPVGIELKIVSAFPTVSVDDSCLQHKEGESLPSPP